MGRGVQMECHGSARFSRNIAHRHDANARLASQKCTIDPAAARRRVHHDAHAHRLRPSIIGGDAHRSGERRHATRVMAR